MVHPREHCVWQRLRRAAGAVVRPEGPVGDLGTRAVRVGREARVLAVGALVHDEVLEREAEQRVADRSLHVLLRALLRARVPEFTCYNVQYSTVQTILEKTLLLHVKH